MTNDLLTKEDLSLFTSGTRLTLGSIYFQEGFKDTLANFDLLVREMPKTRNYLVFGGLEHIARYLQNLKFNNEQLKWLKAQFNFSPDEMGYFKNFRFSGDMWAMPEGSLFFPNEPIIRISAPIIEAQIIEMFLINAVYLQTALASKLARFVCAANGKNVVLGFNRSYGIDAAMKATRWSKIFGAQTSLAAYNFKCDDDIHAIGIFHYFVMAFNSELEAFRKYIKYSRGKGYVLVDTYDTLRGIKNFIKAAREIEKEGVKATGIQLDSGDLYELSAAARKMLNEAGLSHAKIFAMSNLDEWKVAALEKKRAPIDVYAGVTELLTPADAPTLEVVYKLSALKDKNQWMPKMKLSSKKISLPGRKQVFRIEKHGQYIGDVIGLENEKIRGKKLLVPYIKNGKLVRKLPSLEEIHKYYEREKKKFKRELFAIDKKVKYPVEISAELNKMTAQTKKQIQKQFIN